MSNPLPVVWLPQTPGLCGAACAQMILNARGIVGTEPSDLEALWEQIKANTIRDSPGNGKKRSLAPCGRFRAQVCEQCRFTPPFCWCTFPTALAGTLNGYLGENMVSVHKETRERDTTERLVQSVDDGIAAGALVHHGTHWVVAYGYLPVKPAADQLLTHLLVRDSEFNAPSTLITMSHWLAFELTEIRCGRFTPFSLGVTSGAERRRKLIPDAVKLTALAPIVEPAQISAQAKADAEWLVTTLKWEASVGRATANDPIFVRDLTRSQRDYYLVDFRTEGRPTARMIFDARQRVGGQYAGVDESGAGHARRELPPLITRSDVERLMQARSEPDNSSGAYAVESTLVWKPCDQSHSRYQPFYVVRRDRDVHYVRVDGAVFSELTEVGGGA